MDRDRLRIISRLKKYFDIYDINKDGYINYIELELLLEKLHINHALYINKFKNESFVDKSKYSLTDSILRTSTNITNKLISFEEFIEKYLSITKSSEPIGVPVSKNVNIVF